MLHNYSITITITLKSVGLLYFTITLSQLPCYTLISQLLSLYHNYLNHNYLNHNYLNYHYHNPPLTTLVTVT